MPQLMGLARERSGGFALPTVLVVVVLLLAAALVGVIRQRYRRADENLQNEALSRTQ
jgi:hypothetical protein